MVQGYVLYPKKGELNSNARLAQALDTLLAQFTEQNKKVEESAIKLFHSPIGVSRTELRPDFQPEFPNAPAIIPVETAAQLVIYNNPFLTKGHFGDDFKEYRPVVQKGILVSEKEYDQLKNLYLEIFQETKPYSNSFSQSKAVGNYLKVLKKYNAAPKKINSGDLLGKSMAYSVAMSTGFDNSGEDLVSKYTLSGWEKAK